jgi:phosphatidate phosphatase APP1
LSALRRITLRSLYGLKFQLSKLVLALGLKSGFIRTILIQPYKGFGSKNEIYFIGRVLRDRGIGISNIQDSRWKNFLRMYKRFMSWKIPGVRIHAEFMGQEQTVLSDDQGYFEVRMRSELPFEVEHPWQEIRLRLVDKVVRNQAEVKAGNLVFIPSGHVEYGVISDIDDTIVPTGATRLWEMLKTTFLGNAHTRLPFAGVSAFYQAMAKGSDGIESNPFFYVSSSPWNLYDFLMEFLDVHQIPKGPLMLRDLGLSREQFIAGSHADHKLHQVEKIFELVKDIPFILIGDSGQHDPEIYLQVIKDYPGRVKMIYIRDVKPARQTEVQRIAAEIRDLGVELLLVEDTEQAAYHALEKGWIRIDDVRDILDAKKEDETPET